MPLKMCSATHDINGCPFLIGTSGFSYQEWIDSGFYPKKTKSAHMLELYSRSFSLVELNYTWYQMVRAEAMERMLTRVGDDFYCTAKLTRTMTHDIADNWPTQAELYSRGIAPLMSSGRLLAVLIQFPPSFRRTTGNRQYLARLFDRLQKLPLAVEFRHRSWARERVYSGLRDRGVTMVTVDAPALPDLFPALDIITNPSLFYLRLHGRNGRDWYCGTMQKQFNYCYSEQELRGWVERIQNNPAMGSRCRRGIIVFNNHVAGQAVNNGRTMACLLEQQAGPMAGTEKE